MNSLSRRRSLVCEIDPVSALARYRIVRSQTERLAGPLSPEDQQVQSMPDCSPTKWHRAHTTWFFETFLLAARPGYEPFDPAFAYLFNSYYETVGPRHPRPERGLLTRPAATEVARYRAEIDRRVEELIAAGAMTADEFALLELGLQHEQQHQELILTDIKHAFWSNPTRPAYAPPGPAPRGSPPPQDWIDVGPGLYEIGAQGEGFAFDNEGPRHLAYLQGALIATRPVACGEYLQFVAAGGYERPEYWLSDGWATVEREGWRAPDYWISGADGWRIFTLAGERPLCLAEPVQNVSFYEAFAYANWAGMRLPTECEWEVALAGIWCSPRPGRVHADPMEERRSFGEVWEWTASAYAPYPGYRPMRGAIGEYNGKFMSNQMVLRGSSWATSEGHDRPTYRNFFPPAARWQATGFRLAVDL